MFILHVVLSHPLFLLPRLLWGFLSLAVPAEGGSSTPSSPPPAAPGSTAPLIPTIAGTGSDLGYDVVGFSHTVQSTTGVGSFRLRDAIGGTIWAKSRASASIEGNLSVQVIIKPDSSSTGLVHASGMLAIMPSAPSGYSFPNTVATLGMCPGVIAVTATALTSSDAQTLVFPPTAQRDLLISGVVGRDAHVVFAFDKVKVEIITMTIRGVLRLSGLGYPDAFFLSTK
jgi:hypothetical protein